MPHSMGITGRDPYSIVWLWALTLLGAQSVLDQRPIISLQLITVRGCVYSHNMLLTCAQQFYLAEINL